MDDEFPAAEVRCPGCHRGDFADFDHYVDAHQIPPADYPAAFAAWLHLASGRAWDGDVERVDDDQ
ncbi:hypothetical protein [Amycolatopsis thermoflava]|uniref:hypothetical protein n=1 Tax=Amycolatopsis thermoflava TaxID=84480 RepID=UPI003F4A76DB